MSGSCPQNVCSATLLLASLYPTLPPNHLDHQKLSLGTSYPNIQ